MKSWKSLLIVLATAAIARGGVFSYESDVLPTNGGWELIQAFCEPQEWLDGGCLFHHVESCDAFPPPGGQQFDYTRSLADQEGETAWFVEWRVMTDGDRSEFTGVAPAALVAGSFGPVNYGFTIARDQAKLNRDNLLPIVFVDIEPGVPHTYRLELYDAARYVWFIDGIIVDSGIPEGAFPSFFPAINWRTKSWLLPNTTQWDYIRFGTIPQRSSGDFNSDGLVDTNDLYFFTDCLLGPDAAGPGCQWADMNNDGTADGNDIQLFADAMLSS